MKKYILVIAAISFAILSCKKKDTDTTATTTTSSTTGTTTGGADPCAHLYKTRLDSIQVFPKDNPLNTDISGSAVDPNSSAIMTTLGSTPLHNDFGNAYGIPFVVVCGKQAKVPITYVLYGNESDAGPFPIPDNAPIEAAGVGDAHVLVCDVENLKLYELYNAKKISGGWQAGCGALWDLKTNYYRTEGWTSADAAGLPILPCLVRYDEVASGEIHHAIRFTVSKSKVYKGYVSPASHKVNGSGSLGSSLPMGARLRLKAGVDISTFSTTNKVILTAMKKYGIILADIGSDMYITGAPDSRWDDNDIHNLNKIKASDFEVVKMGTIK
ncbi:MAG: hypothetical protein NTX03_10995 [Bacteroidetes bacterium]|nr:hypothetical protein [Bacteroidota bacterium]